MSVGLINRADMNIREYFGDELENVGLKSHPVFKLFAEPSKRLDIPSGHVTPSAPETGSVTFSKLLT